MVLEECMDPEDEDGFIPYAREYNRKLIKQTKERTNVRAMHLGRRIDSQLRNSGIEYLEYC